MSSEGLKPDPTKIDAVLKMKPPSDKAAVERLRGMVNYLARFVPRLSDVMRPINALTRDAQSGHGTVCTTKHLKS